MLGVQTLWNRCLLSCNKLLCVYIFIVLAYDGPCSVLFAEWSRRVTWMCIKRVLCWFCCSELLFNCFTVHATSTFFIFFYPIWLNLADSRHTLPIRPRFMSVFLFYTSSEMSLCFPRDTCISLLPPHVLFEVIFRARDPLHPLTELLGRNNRAT